jgi:RimJ/RimL family protein N-acetyltransferase
MSSINMHLVDVYNEDATRPATKYLYDLLKERDPAANISHREMPSYDEHVAFVDSHPYQEWFIIFIPDRPVGAIYLTKQNEIGIFIAKSEQGNGYGKAAVNLLMQVNPGKKFLANIAPGNARSLAMFTKMGFELCQMTLAKEQ